MIHYSVLITVAHLLLLVVLGFPVTWWLWTEVPALRRWTRGRLNG